MRDFTRPPKFILSAERKELTPEANALRHAELGEKIKALGYHGIEVDGVYDGVAEKSWLVFNPRDNKLRELAAEYDQESTLFIDFENTATLGDRVGIALAVGKWTEVDDPGTRDHTVVKTEDATYYYVVEWAWRADKAA